MPKHLRFTGQLVLALVIVAAVGGSVFAGEALRKVSFRLDTSFLPKHGIFFVALEKGYYKEAGLDVTIIPGTGSLGTVQTVAAGRDTFGFADAGTMILGRSQGAMVKDIGMIHAKSPFSVITLKKYNIKTPKELEGKAIASEPAGSSYILLPVFFKLAGLDSAKIKLIPTDPTSKVPGLLAGRFEAVSSYLVSDPPVIVASGEEPVIFPWSDYGFKMYSNGLIAADKTIKEDPDLVRKFVHATFKGIKYANDHPDDAAEILVKHVREINPKAAKMGVEMACKILWSDEATANGIGYMTKEMWETTQKTLVDFMNLKQTFPVEELFTNEFLPGKM
jgi:NitT/TauT family transport system substrate-binding protein